MGYLTGLSRRFDEASGKFARGLDNLPGVKAMRQEESDTEALRRMLAPREQLVDTDTGAAIEAESDPVKRALSMREPGAASGREFSADKAWEGSNVSKFSKQSIEPSLSDALSSRDFPEAVRAEGSTEALKGLSLPEILASRDRVRGRAGAGRSNAQDFKDAAEGHYKLTLARLFDKWGSAKDRKEREAVEKAIQGILGGMGGGGFPGDVPKPPI